MSDSPFIDHDLSPVPYEDGDHCIFYAVQAASMFFNNQPLTLKDRHEYGEMHSRTVDWANKLVDKNSDYFTISLLVALRNIHSKLKDMSIFISSVSGTEDILKPIEQDNFIKREKINTKVVNEEDDIDLKFPVLIFSHNKTGFHVWCPTSEQEFNEDIDKNVTKAGIILTAQLQRVVTS